MGRENGLKPVGKILRVEEGGNTLSERKSLDGGKSFGEKVADTLLGLKLPKLVCWFGEKAGREDQILAPFGRSRFKKKEPPRGFRITKPREKRISGGWDEKKWEKWKIGTFRGK